MKIKQHIEKQHLKKGQAMKQHHLGKWFVIVLTVVLFLLNTPNANAETATTVKRNAVKKKPNILILFADDQNPHAANALGNSEVKTPHIDRLVKNGFRFTRAYCMGATGGAVCVSSRAMLNTGRSLFHVKSSMQNATLLPELLGKNGYTTFATGKWHNGHASFLRGFQQGKSIMFQGMSNHIKIALQDIAARNAPANQRIVNRRTGTTFSSEEFANTTIKFLNSQKNQKSDKPFYAYVAFTAPHDPRQAPGKFMKMYDPKKITLPKNFLPQHPFNNSWLKLRDEVLAPWPRTKLVIQHQTAEYYALISHLDAQVGRIIKTLKETGLDKNTIVIYAADHGLAMGRHGLLGKQSLYEHSMNTPLIFTGPGIPKGKTSDKLVYLHDIFPTVCQLTGQKVPADVATDTISLADMWGDRKYEVRTYLFTAFAKAARAVRDDRWKLIRYPNINKSQLFDLKNDPLEMNDLAEKKEHAHHLKRLMAELITQQKKHNDTLPLTSKNPLKTFKDMTGQTRHSDRWQPQWIVDKYFKMKGWSKDGYKKP